MGIPHKATAPPSAKMPASSFPTRTCSTPGILPHHTNWADFFRNLKFVVIDEMHTYRGVFGSHVANVIRRLKRVARFYGANPQFILTSATIGNPRELAEKLIEAPVTLGRPGWLLARRTPFSDLQPARHR